MVSENSITPEVDKDKEIYELLVLLRDNYNQYYKSIAYLCIVVDWMRFELFINEREYVVLSEYMKKCTPKEMAPNGPWFNKGDIKSRRLWLDQNIKLNS